AEWYRFGRSQNIDKQDLQKLVVPRLVESLRVSLDREGTFALDNVDVGGIIPVGPANDQLAFLLGILNGPIANIVFRAISKPFQNDYRSANKQFIAPIPSPLVTPAHRADVAGRALALQELWTRRRSLLNEAESRLASLARARCPARWLWPELRTHEDVNAQVPRALRTYINERRKWVAEEMEKQAADRIAELKASIDRGGPPDVAFERGELTLSFGGVSALAGVFLDPPEGRLTEAHWRYLFIVQRRRDAAALARELRRPPIGAETSAARQFIERVAELVRLGAEIVVAEAAMNELMYNLYNLDADEHALVERDCERRMNT
ncbi:MAG: Eco57I restriction-modification methylase domain-containing protein, partial [Chthoniobacterales bacterium]